MNTQEIMGLVLFGIIILTISYIVFNFDKSKYTEDEEGEITVVQGGAPNLSVDKFGRYKVKLSSGQSLTILGKLSAILNNNSVVSYHEIK